MKKSDFNQNWQFTSKKTGETKTVCLPHDATISEERDPDIPIGYLCAFYHGGEYRYHKKFNMAIQEAEQPHYLEFEGIYCNFTVSINGTECAKLVNGYTGIMIDCTGKFRAGENEIEVNVNTPYTDHSRWYAGSGIYRDVFLYTGEKSYIPPRGVKVTTLSHELPCVNVKTKTVGEYDSLCIEVYDGDKLVASTFGENTDIEIPNAELWSDDAPFLYTLTVKMQKDGRICDSVSVPFGIRTLEWNSKEGFLVNGKRTLLRGGCIHQDNGVIGCVTTRESEMRRVQKIKAAGFNAIRSAHHPASSALLEACDIYGIYVMDESFDSWYRMKTLKDFSWAFYDEYETVVKSMAEKDYNHPSVIMYSIGNEIPEIGSLKGVRFGKQMAEMIREIDTTRPILACPSIRLAKDFLRETPYAEVDEDEYLITDERKQKDFQHYVKVWTRGLANILSVDEYSEERKQLDETATKELYSCLDMAGYNYYGEYFEDIHNIHPEYVIVSTESEGNKVGYHYDLMKKHPYIIGDFVWTLQDHLGECNCAEQNYGEDRPDKSYPWRTNWCGKLDLIGHENITAHRYRMVWGLEEGIVLAAQPPVFKVVPTFAGDRETDAVMSWSYEGCENEPTYIDVVTTAPLAEVFINGRSLGKKDVIDFAARFPAIYEAGEVKAVGYDNAGNILFQNKLVSAKKDTELTVTPDKTVLTANGKDLCFIEIDVTDGEIIKSLLERKISVEVNGAGCLEGLGSAAYKSEENYCTGEHTTFYGRCLAVVRSGDRKGEIDVKVQSGGVKTVVVKLECK